MASAKSLNTAGFGLTLLAFVGPFVPLALGTRTAFQVGEDIPRTLGSLAVLMLVSWLITRNRSAEAKGLARVVVGLLLCALVASHVYAQSREEQLGKQFLQDSIAFQQRQSAKFQDLAERFNTVSVNNILTPETLTTPAGQATARAILAQYRALLAERKLLLQTYLAEWERFVATIPPGDMRDGAIAGMSGGKDATVALYADLDRTQTALADSIERVINWGQAQAGHLGMRGGQLLFETKEQQAALQPFLAKVSAAEADMNKSIQSATVAQAKAQDKARTKIQEAQQLLSK